MIIYWDTLKGTGGGGGTSIDPGVSNVLAGVNYEINNVPLVGTYVPPVSVDPGITNVLAGVHYEINNVNLVGTLNQIKIYPGCVIVGQVITNTIVGQTISDATVVGVIDC